MSIIGFTLLLVILLLGYYYYKNSNKKTNEKLKEENEILENTSSIPDAEEQIIDIEKQTMKLSPERVYRSFINIKYHPDYSHVLSALNDLVPRVKTYFNVANIPMNIEEPHLNEVIDLITSFINMLNVTVSETVSKYRQSNTGWDEQLQEPAYVSGWDKAQQVLGLPQSLYRKPAQKAIIKLIDVSNIKKYSTDDEVKYVADLVVHNPYSKLQMSFKIGFVYDLRDSKNENNFYRKPVKEAILDIKIEDMYINGYYSRDPDLVFNENMEDPGNPEYEKYDILNNFNDFDNYNVQNNMTDPKLIQKVLLEKYAERTIEGRQRTAMLDNEGRDFHSSLPKLYEYDNIHATQTIFDDMNKKRVFS